VCSARLFVFFFNDTATTEIYTLSLHDALPISAADPMAAQPWHRAADPRGRRSEEHTSELQSLTNLVCRLLLEKKNEHSSTERICRYAGAWSQIYGGTPGS